MIEAEIIVLLKNSIQHFKNTNFTQLSQKTEEAITFPNSLYEADMILIPKTGKDRKQKKSKNKQTKTNHYRS